ncbi:MAG TPA: single-stranded-DNA-specific exonuclease RecJ [Ktedonobacteraceae bacterium]|nr:single-stranded-DNA-specific exonuclease RecJ [Ktedonobacteraceae bacterium]
MATMAEQAPVSSWSVYPTLAKEQFEAYRTAGIEALHAQLLVNRGITTPDAMRRFLDARFEDLLDPFLLNDMQRAVERILRALGDSEHITVYGDFDADGVTSAALLTRALRKLKQPGATLDYFIPHRLEDARSLSKDSLDRLRARGTTLVITTDCGSSDVEEITYAQRLGIDVIVTDHHHPPETLPAAYALINPWRADTIYPEQVLCGAGTAFKLAQALFRSTGRDVAETRDILDLVAIGTVGDVATLLGENHTLVRLGLQQLNQTTNPGLRALVQVAGLQTGRLRERDISYALGPRINAAGRMKHAGIAFELLTTDDQAQAQVLAKELEELNQSRQLLTEELMQRVREQAREQSGNAVILVYGNKNEWPEGIIGLVAGRLSEEIRRPVFVLSQDSETSRGSARSHSDFNLIEALRERADLFERHGGHAQAAGFTIANANIDELHRHLLAWQGRSNGANDQPADSSEPASTASTSSTDIDPAVVVLEEESPTRVAHRVDVLVTKPETQLTYEVCTKIGLLSPFGAGNPEPTFRLNNARITRRWPSGPENRHLRLRLRVNDMQYNGTFLRAGSRIDAFPEGARVNVIFNLEPQWNAFEQESRQEVRLRILAMDTIAD